MFGGLRGIKVLIVPIVAAFALVAVACGGSSSPVIIDGQEVSSPEETLKKAEETTLGIASAEGATTGDDFRCYYVKSADVTPNTYEPELVCGPILFPGENVEAPWLRLGLEVEAEIDNNGERVATAIPSGSFSETNYAVKNLAALWRPDGKKAPENNNLQAPPATPVGQDFAELIFSSDIEQRLEVVDYQANFIDAALKVTGMAKPEVINTSEGKRRAPDGYEMVVIEYEVAFSGERQMSYGPVDDYDEYDAVDAALRLDRDSNSIAIENGETAPSGQLMAFSNKIGQEPVLSYEEYGIEQGINLATGDLVDLGSGIPEVLYRTNTISKEKQQTLLPFAIPETFELGKYPYEIIITESRLVYRADKTTPSSPERAWLVFDLEVSGGNTWRTARSVTGNEMVLNLPDGSTVNATVFQEGTNIDKGILPLWWAFEVPADFTQGEVVITPGSTPYRATILSSLLFEDAQAIWNVNIPNP